MKLNIYLTLVLASLFLWSSCSREDDITQAKGEQAIDGLSIEINGMDINGSVTTRAAGDFAVNTTSDPTVAPRTADWELSVSIYNKQVNNDLYNASVCQYVAPNWKPENIIYFPSYLKQDVTATLYPKGWTESVQIATDQSDPAVLLLQDILAQRGYPNKEEVTPAHIPTIYMQHKYAMLDFILNDVDMSMIDLTTIRVIDGETIYTPFKTNNSEKLEYLVILPLGVKDPKVTLTTVGGIRYEEKIEITPVHADGTRSNYSYCMNLLGVELLLSSVTVADWLPGEALAGQYTTIASNPTFRGPVGEEVTLIYDNGEEQTIFFNRWGEATIQPAGRTIIKLRKGDGQEVTLSPTIVLRDMYIDLTPYWNNRL